MKNSIKQFGIILLCFSWTGVTNASTWLPGTAVGSPGSETMVGSLGGPSPDGLLPGQTGLTNAIEYFIPLNDNNYGGTYGVTGGFDCYYNSQEPATAGTCSDYGNGDVDQYNDASSLKMNIWYDTDNAQFSSASLAFAFDDLDLMPDNDPFGFYESISLSYWSWNDSDFDLNTVRSQRLSILPFPMYLRLRYQT